MRRAVATLASALIALSGFQPSRALAQGQVALAPVPGPQSILQAIASFPGGGEPLKQQISDLIQKNPELAANVANDLRDESAGLSAVQKEAVEAGLADALNKLGVEGFAGLAFSPLLLGVGAGVAAGGTAAGVLLTKKAASPN